MLAESRFLTRLGSEMCQRIVVARARIHVLPPGNPVAAVLRGASRMTGRTWLTDAEAVMADLGIDSDLDMHFAVEGFDLSRPKTRKAIVAKWKHRVVVPCVRRRETAWFHQQLAALNNEGLIPYADLVPLGQPLHLELRWAPWGRTMWRFYKAWCVARATSCIPVAVWGRAGPGGRSGLCTRLDHCCLCGQRDACLDHVLTRCPVLQIHRAGLPHEVLPVRLAWVLMYADSLPELEAKVRFFGLCIGAVIAGLPR